MKLFSPTFQNINNLLENKIATYTLFVFGLPWILFQEVH